MANYPQQKQISARQLRRAEERKAVKKGVLWTDLASLADDARKIVVTQLGIPISLLRNEHAAAFIPAEHRTLVEGALETAENDMKAFIGMLDELGKEHEGRKGKPVSDDDALKGARIYQQYIDLLNRFYSTCEVNSNYLLSITSTVEEKVNEAQRALKAQGVVFSEDGTKVLHHPDAPQGTDVDVAEAQAATAA